MVRKKVDQSEENDQGKKSLAVVPDKIVPMSGDEPFADLRQKVVNLRDVMNSSRWDLAEVLSEIRGNQIYHHWGYSAWDTYIENEIGLTGRTVMYLTSMYDWFVLKVGPELTPEHLEQVIARVKALGWTKSRLLVGIAVADNVDAWLDKAEKFTCSELEAITRSEPSVKDKEKIDKEKLGVSKTFKFSAEQWKTVEQAIEIAATLSESDKSGHCMQLICQDFVATNMAQKDGGQKSRGKYFDRMAAIFGAWVIVVDKETGKVVHGESALKKISV
jgi:hypothetical protein